MAGSSEDKFKERADSSDELIAQPVGAFNEPLFGTGGPPRAIGPMSRPSTCEGYIDRIIGLVTDCAVDLITGKGLAHGRGGLAYERLFALTHVAPSQTLQTRRPFEGVADGRVD
ncbi:hypothetical protein SLS62_006766 [Diatrype stigma]|uniref:Uncharacterized protein n=1 Tax=Diatrype stigma TaxID=117547 RepID=A0AAN9YNS6_9PEZI